VLLVALGNYQSGERAALSAAGPAPR